MAKFQVFQPIYQLRVAPDLKWPFKKHPVYFDSGLLFVSDKDAKDYIGQYIRELIDQKLLDSKRGYEISILKLKVYNPPLEGIAGMTTQNRKE